MKKIMSFILAATVLLSTSGCFGEFAMVRKLYTWNDNLSDSKVVRSLVFYGLNIIPVYGFAGAADFFVFNLVEFWSGSNPVAMNAGDMEEQTISMDGAKYHVVATQNQFEITPEGEQPVILRYHEADHSWYMSQNGDTDKVLSLLQTEKGLYYQIHGEQQTQMVAAEQFIPKQPISH